MSTRDVYESGFDESSGKIIPTTDCPECDGRLATEGGEIACSDCGLIVNEYHFDHGATPVSFPDDPDNREQTGAPLTVARHDRGLSSEIGFQRDGKGNTLPGKKRRQLNRLRREHARAKWRSTAERNLGHACTEIARLTSALDLPYSFREEAARLYRQAHEANLIQGRSVEGMATASVYAACRQRGQPQTRPDVAAVARCSEASLTTCYSVLNRELGLSVEPRTPQAFIPKLVSLLGLSQPIERQATRLAARVTDAGFAVGSNPVGVAAGCLAVMIDEHDISVTQVALAEAADVSTVTVRSHRDTVRDIMTG